MTPKEKAKQLVDKYYTNNDLPLQTLSFIKSKQCALIAIEYILEILPKSEYLEDRGEYHENRELIYWQQVKQEIEKL